jgi:hypothetical protein
MPVRSALRCSERADGGWSERCPIYARNRPGRGCVFTRLLLARYGEPEASHRAIPKLSQEVLAEMVGTTRPRVNFFMNAAFLALAQSCDESARQPGESPGWPPRQVA